MSRSARSFGSPVARAKAAMPSMQAIFLARGPAFRSGISVPGFDNVDVYPLLTRLLGIDAAPNDGNPQTLLPALNDGSVRNH